MSLKTSNSGKVSLNKDFKLLRDLGHPIEITTLLVDNILVGDKVITLLYINPSINVLVRVGMIKVLSYMGTSFDIGEALSDRGIVVENFVNL